MVTAYSLSLMAMHDYRTSPARTLAAQHAKYRFLKGLHSLSEGKRSKSSR
jgi:hypothetical protein